MYVDEMLAFNDDCESAAQQCPQWRGESVEDRDICLCKISAKNLVKYWKECDTLWNLGYSDCLSIDAEEVFREYKKYKKVLSAWKINQRTLHFKTKDLVQ